MRFLRRLAFAALLALPVAAPAWAADVPLKGAGLTSVLESDKVWCAAWREDDQSCEEVLFLDAKAGKVIQTRRYQLSDTSSVELVVRETVKIEADRLCSTYRFADLDIVVLADGSPAPAEQAAPAMSLVAALMAELEGKKTCETLVRDDKTGAIKSSVTIDGEVAPEFDADYRLLAPDARIKLRPLFEDTPDTSVT
ncbi:MAG: hypothetical protein KA105_05005 [Caulobacter sp.]|nr:hypothetical protein [Caulobacter sp.]